MASNSNTPSDSDSVYFYNPSFAASIIFIILYFIPMAILFYQTFRYRTWYFLCVPIGAVIEVGGYIARAYSTKHNTVVTPYAVSLSWIVLAPLFIAAGNYLLIGRLVRAVLPKSTGERPNNHTLFEIRSTRTTKTFVGCDIVSFLIQCAGSGVASSNNWEGIEMKVGVNVLIAGLATQLVTIIVFCFMVLRFTQRAVWQHEAKADAPDGWQNVLSSMTISVPLIIIRSLYRLIEFALGVDGYAFRHEWVFYIFESLPMVPAIAIFCWWFPGRYLKREEPHDNEREPKRTSTFQMRAREPIV